MKKVLVIGAAGTVGLELLKHLLTEGKYNITALDLKNSNVHNKLKKYKKRMNIIYADACDRILIESVVKDHDYIINLATVLPPFGLIKKTLTKTIEFDIVENLCRAISYYNPNCHLVEASSTSLYASSDKLKKVTSEIKIDKYDYYSMFKNKAEKLIREKVKKYTIVRVPLVLDNDPDKPFILGVKEGENFSCITKKDAAYAFCKVLEHLDELNKKEINIAGAEEFNLPYKELYNKLIKYRGIGMDMLFQTLFFEKKYKSPVCEDVSKFNDILDYQTDNLENYFSRLKYSSRHRKLQLLLGKLHNKIWRK